MFLKQHFWCRNCAFLAQSETWQKYLLWDTGLGVAIALQLFEAPEQKILAFYRWETEHARDRLIWQVNSKVLSTKCQKQVKVPISSLLRKPIVGNPDLELDRLIENVQALKLRFNQKKL